MNSDKNPNRVFRSKDGKTLNIIMEETDSGFRFVLPESKSIDTVRYIGFNGSLKDHDKDLISKLILTFFLHVKETLGD